MTAERSEPYGLNNLLEFIKTIISQLFLILAIYVNYSLISICC